MRGRKGEKGTAAGVGRAARAAGRPLLSLVPTIPPFLLLPVLPRRLEAELTLLQSQTEEADAALAERRARLAEAGTRLAGSEAGRPLPNPARPASPAGSAMSSPWGTDASDDDEG